ncbi:alpha/beta fold hydrolase [Arthrobacter sp. SO3]|uniref:alpha/beta fold hydrolase n=1 Tax=Arthrobacter sp. SO3 TaxID=1897057 RepID=UPI001CFF6B05|nr:alpha/beta hydrolase [Arthrobacter sp. SO3]MCB5292684.1 3-oxoadipate enol-lactonase 2 [Arthrobacter sp. SO3]
MALHPTDEQIRTWIRVPGMLCTAGIFTAMDPYLNLGGTTRDVPIRGTTLDEASGHIVALAMDRPGPVGIIGLSLGAIIAMAAAVKDPGLFDTAILISTNPRGPRPEQIQAWDAMARRNRAGALHDIAAETAPALFAPDRRTGPLPGVGAAMANDIGRDAFADQLGIQRSRRDLRPELARVSARTLVLAGTEDQLCGLELHRDIAAALPNADLEVLAGAGHLMTLEDPASTANIINNWNLRKAI